jgi:hypothetical protein
MRCTRISLLRYDRCLLLSNAACSAAINHDEALLRTCACQGMSTRQLVACRSMVMCRLRLRYCPAWTTGGQGIDRTAARGGDLIGNTLP